MDEAVQQAKGTDWTPEENDILVADYFAMLGEELAGRPYNKAEHRRAVVARTGRTEPSVEFKHRNLSAVLMKIGLPRIKGYVPAWNAQFTGLALAVERRLCSDGSLLSPPTIILKEDKRQEPLRRLARTFDPVARDARNRTLGKQGEQFVMEAEERRLHAAGRHDLMRQVRWVADMDGDGAGYDIHSFDPVTAAPRLIEVKTTCGDALTPFFITRNEEALSRERPNEFALYRLFDFSAKPRIFELRPPLDGAVRLETATWAASFR